MIRLTCPRCRKFLQAPESAAGRTFPCPSCAGPVPLPGAEEDIPYADLAPPARHAPLPFDPRGSEPDPPALALPVADDRPSRGG